MQPPTFKTTKDGLKLEGRKEKKQLYFCVSEMN